MILLFTFHYTYLSSLSPLKKKKILFIFRDGEGGKKGEKHQCVVASHASPTGDMACNPGMCPDSESNQPLFGLQVSTQSTEPHQPGPLSPFITYLLDSVLNIFVSFTTAFTMMS